jgi:hypothetical protein
MSSDRRSATRLPEDPAYWEDLAARSVAAAFRMSTATADGRPVAHPRDGSRFVHAGRGAFEPWWRGMSDAAFVLAASAVFALIGGSLLLGERSPPPDTEAHALTGALAPEDPLLASLLAAPAGPPPASALLRLVALRGDER